MVLGNTEGARFLDERLLVDGGWASNPARLLEPAADAGVLAQPRKLHTTGWPARSVSQRLLQLLRRQTPTAVSPAGENVEALRRRWASEKQMLIADCTAARSELATLTQTLNGWQALVRDILFYGGLHGRAAEMTAQFAEQLRGSLGELEIVQEVEVTELHLPSAPDHSPQVRLIKYCGPELSEWNVLWEHSNAQVKRCQAEYCW